MQSKRTLRHGLFSIAAILLVEAIASWPLPAADPGPFGIASGGESLGDHPRLFPLLHEAGVCIVRSFPEWAEFQPQKGQWKWARADALVESARKNQLQIAGVLMYLAPWASSAAPGADHGNATRTFPIRDMQFWRDYVGGVVDRYRGQIRYWEIYNEFNSPGFARAATVIDLTGEHSEAKAEQDLPLTRAPLFVSGLPDRWAADARANRDRPFPWLKDYSAAESVSCQMGAANVESGLAQLDKGDGHTVAGLVDGAHVRRTDKANKSLYIYFDVDDSYASVGDSQIDVTVIARRVDPAKSGGCTLTYESSKGYRQAGEWWTIPEGAGWHQHTFRLKDANFANNWGWNFRISAVASPDDIWVKEVVVRRIGPKRA